MVLIQLSVVGSSTSLCSLGESATTRMHIMCGFAVNCVGAGITAVVLELHQVWPSWMTIILCAPPVCSGVF